MLSDKQFLKLCQISYIDFPNIMIRDVNNNYVVDPEHYDDKTIEQIYNYIKDEPITVTRAGSDTPENCMYINALTPLNEKGELNPENGTVYQREMEDIISAMAGHHAPNSTIDDSELSQYAVFKDMKLVAYENDNKTASNPEGTGFVVYAI